MKRTTNNRTLLPVMAAVAGVVMGASCALAAHPPIQLFTYEEVATQMNGSSVPGNPFGTPARPLPVLVGSTNKQGFPYSPKQTCSGGGVESARCHSDNTTDKNAKGNFLKGYTALADHAFHSAMGTPEWMDNSKSGLFISTGPSDLVPAGTQTGLAANKPWTQSHGHNGKW
jgi:hypothetical protein